MQFNINAQEIILILCLIVRFHQRKMEGGTYSPRKAEMTETKSKLDQLVAVADLELKQENLNRLVCVFIFDVKASIRRT